MKKEERTASKTAIVEATFRKMGWLVGYFSRAEVETVSFTAFTHDLLAQDCEFDRYAEEDCGPFGESLHLGRARIGKKILLFSKDGRLIGQVGRKIFHVPAGRQYRPRFLWGTRGVNTPEHEEITFFQETVGQALQRLDTKNEAYYIIGLHDNNLKITKPPGDGGFNEAIMAEMKKAEEEVEAAIR